MSKNPCRTCGRPSAYSKCTLCASVEDHLDRYAESPSGVARLTAKLQALGYTVVKTDSVFSETVECTIIRAAGSTT